MSATDNRRRKRTLNRLILGVALLWICVAALHVLSPSGREVSPRMGNLVFSGGDALSETLARIRFETADSAYTLERQDGRWTMRESGGYPLAPEKVEAFFTGLADLSWGEARTTSPEKLGLLGLSDPRDGGNGILMQLTGPEGRPRGVIIIGRRNGYLYGRRAGETESFRLDGELPAIYGRRAWLDLDVVSIDPATIAGVRINDTTGRTLYLERETGEDERAFAPAPPNENASLISELTASSTAMALSRFEPLDVKPASDLDARQAGEHITHTFDQLEVTTQAFEDDDGFWVTLRAVEAGNAANRAAAINAQAEGWAFRLTEYDWQDYAVSVSELIWPEAP